MHEFALYVSSVYYIRILKVLDTSVSDMSHKLLLLRKVSNKKRHFIKNLIAGVDGPILE